MTKGYLIDPTAKTVELVDVSDYTDIQKHIGCRCFTMASHFPNGDALFVDDEGLLTGGLLSFNIEGGHQPFFGKGLLVGSDVEGDRKDPYMSMVDFAQKVNYSPQYESTGV